MKNEDLPMHPQTIRMEVANQRYVDRFRAAHPHWHDDSAKRITLEDDHKLFGDIIEPKILNAMNVVSTRTYCDNAVARIVEMLDDDDVAEGGFDEEDLMRLIMPVLAGMFEHVWLTGYFYRDEIVKEKRAEEVKIDDDNKNPRWQRWFGA